MRTSVDSLVCQNIVISLMYIFSLAVQTSTTGKHRQLAATNVNMRKYASVESTQHELHLTLKPMTKKITSATLECTLSCVFLREGKAT